MATRRLHRLYVVTPDYKPVVRSSIQGFTLSHAPVLPVDVSTGAGRTGTKIHQAAAASALFVSVNSTHWS